MNHAPTTLTQRLQAHFDKWKAEFFRHHTFYEDGIIDEVSYSQSKIKILFVAKEPNGRNHEHVASRSFCDEWSRDMPSYRFASRIAEWAGGVLDSFPDFDQIQKGDKHHFLRQIAFMNVKKHAGVGTIGNIKQFNEFIRPQTALLQGQMEMIAPEIVVLSLSHNRYVRNLLFPSAVWISSGYQIEIARYNNARVIDFYHPSSRNVPAAAYCLLKCVVESSAFRRL